MSEVKQTMTNFNRQVVTIPAYEVATLDFMGIFPNYFRVQNNGANAVFCSPNNIPTSRRYDFTVSGGGLGMYAEPTAKNKLHIYNPNGTPITCTVITFKGEFDPLVLALSNIEVSMPESVESNNVITGFNTSLPTGNNVIGRVKIEGGKDYTELLTNILEKLTDAESGEY